MLKVKNDLSPEIVTETFLQQAQTHPVDTGRKLYVPKTFRRRPTRLLNVLCTFNLRPVSTGQYNLLYHNDFRTRAIRSVNHCSESILFLGPKPKIWILSSLT